MRQFYLAFLFFSATTCAIAQTSVETTSGTIDLIMDSIFGTMSEITVTNYSYSGDSAQIGTFQNSGPDFPMAQGMILGSDNVINAVGGNGGINNTNESDPDLLVYSPDINLYDCAFLEIDFVANTNELILPFVFASDEYPSFTCSLFNDVMAILLKSEGASDYDIYSVVPGTDIPVAVNSINSGIANGGNPQNCDDANPDWEESYIYFNDNTDENANGITIPGFTVSLNATLPLTVGQSYTLKIGIGDAGDDYFGSYVFIKSPNPISSFDCPILEANIGDPCASTNPETVGVISDECSCIQVENHPDLSCGVYVYNSFLSVGDTVHMACHASNLGAVTSSNYVINVYSSDDNQFDPGTDLFLTSFNGEDLNFNETEIFNYDFYPYNLPVHSGNNYLYFDIPGVADENTLDNNTGGAAYHFVTNHFPLVEISAIYSEILLEPEETTFNFSFDTYNLGPNDLDNSPVNLYWSADSIYDVNDMLLSQYMGPALNPGDTITVDLTLSVPQPVTQSSYYVIVVPQEIVKSNSLFDYKVAKILFNTVSVNNIEKTDWKAYFGAGKNLVIEVGNETSGTYKVSLFDQLGKRVLEREINPNPGSIETIPTSGLASGIYVLRITGASDFISAKLPFVD